MEEAGSDLAQDATLRFTQLEVYSQPGMIPSINLSNSYMVPFGSGSALTKCRLITLTQTGAGWRNIFKDSATVQGYLKK